MRTKVRSARGSTDLVRLVPQPRDYECLALIGACRYVTTEQIARTFFPSIDRARKRLRAYYEAGLVNLHLVDSQEPNLVTLTRRGQTEIIHHDPDLDGRIHLPGPIRASGVRHHVLVTDGRLYVAGLAQHDPMVRSFRWSNPRGDLHRELDLRRFHLDPDGLALLVRNNERIRIGVEADAGATESGQTWAGKLTRYKEVFAARLLDELWIVLDQGDGRRASIARLARTACLADRVRVLGRDHVTTRPVAPPPPLVNESPDGR